MADEFDNNDSNDASDWNEQQQFASIYFGLTRDCKTAFNRKMYFELYDLIISKIQCGLAVIKDEKDIEHLLNVKNLLDNVYTFHKKYPNKQNNTGKNFKDILFMAEVATDIAVNKRLPFLKEKEVFDLTDF